MRSTELTHSHRKNRRSIRLKNHDYTNADVYYVTICSFQKECIFGAIENDEMRLNGIGEAVPAGMAGNSPNAPQRIFG